MSNQNDKRIVYKDLTLYDIKVYCRSKYTSHLKGISAGQLANYLFLINDCPQVGWEALKWLDTKLFNEKRAFSYKKAFHQKHGYLWDSISKGLPNIIVDDSFYIGLRKCIEQNSDLPYYKKFYKDYFTKFNVDSIVDFMYTLSEEEKEMTKELLAASLDYYENEVYVKKLYWGKNHKRQLKRDAKKKHLLDMNQDRPIMTEKEKLLFSKLHDKRKVQDEAFNDFTSRNIRRNQAEKYSEEAHFVYELLQNADDAGATYAIFELFEDKLLFRHNGKPFSISEDVEDAKPYGDINSITAPAYSAKQEDHQKIGKFGVGFKAVYIYTDEPEIYSGVFNFKIIHQIVPELIPSCIYPKEEKETLFVLRFKNAERDRIVINNKLKTLDSPLLFLNNLKSIEWKALNGENHKYSITKEYIEDDDNVALDKVEETNDKSHVRYYMFSKLVDLREHGMHRIYAAFPLSENGKLDVYNKIQKVYCFFSTKTCYGMVAKLQAPFLLNESRESVLSYEDTNITLKKELASLMVNSLEMLCKEKLISDNLQYIIPYGYHSTDRWGNNYTGRGVTEDIKDFYEAFTTCLKEKKVFPTKKGLYESYRHVMFTSAKMKELINKEQLNMLMGRTDNALDFLSFEVKGDFEKYLKDTIGIQEFNSDSLVKKIDSKFMEIQTTTWVEKFYKYVESLKTFKYCSFVKTSKGDYESLYLEDGEPNLFAPILGTTNSNTAMTFIDKDTYQNHKLYFDMMGVKEPDEIDYLSSLLNKYEDKEEISDHDIISDIEIVLKIHDEYSNSSKLKDIDSILKKKLRVRVIENKGSVMDHTSFVFIPDPVLVFYNKQTLSTRKELDMSFYTKNGVNEESLCKLVVKIGAVDKGQINLVYYGSYYIAEDVTTEEKTKFTVINKNKTEISPYLNDVINNIGNFQELYEVYDYDIVNIDGNKIDKDISSKIWSYIIEYSPDDICSSKLYYRVWHGSKWYKYEFESSLFYKLKTSAWIVKEDGTHICPTDIKKEDFHQLGYSSNKDWEDILDMGTSAIVKEKNQYLENCRKISEMWNDNFEEAAEWAKLRDRCNSKAINIKVISANLELLANMSNLVGGYDGEIENSQDFPDEDIAQDEFEDLTSPSLVRKTEHYIGIKLYEGLLEKKGISYQVSDSLNNRDYDIKVMPEKLVKISVVKDKEINKDRFAPIGISKDQHKYMNSSNTNKFTLIRIALGDLGLDFDRDIRDIFGAEADVDNDELFRKKCDKFVSDYWKGKSIEDFENMTSEYSIRIYREL